MKKGLIIVLAGAVIAAAAFGGYKVVSSNNSTTATTQQSETSSQQQVPQATSNAEITTEYTTQTTTETTTESTTAAQDTSFITKGYYYLYDDRQTVCCVFAFNGKGKAELARFDETNIEEEDPEFFTGYAKYDIKDGALTVSDMPKMMKMKSVTLTVKDGKLYDGNTELEQHKDLKLSYVLKHFS